MRMRKLQIICLVVAAAGTASGCTGGQQVPPYTVSTGGHAQRGELVIARYECGKCHTIPGIDGANGVVGPPLNFMARRSTLAGNFPNDPHHLVEWVMRPQEMKPGTAMPDLGLSEQQARDVAAYLYTLQ
jgi:cytochrome c2